MSIKEILERLRQGDLSILTVDNIEMINAFAVKMLNIKIGSHTKQDIEMIRDVLNISNILDNNTDKLILPLENGVYDMLVELYKNYSSTPPIGAEPIKFENSGGFEPSEYRRKVIDFIPEEKIDDMLFYEEISKRDQLQRADILRCPIRFDNSSTVTKRLTNTKHNYPKLVGTLDKCKFVLNSQAKEKGVFEDSNVKVLERDFFQKHIDAGILDPNRKFYIVAELKYDGLSVEGDVDTIVESARSRGDTANDKASDLTPILYGYRFKRAVPVKDTFGMKFEAIMTYPNLYKYNMTKGKDYKNCRTAISGLFASSDAPKYRDLITLVPLATSIEGVDRLTEIEFMNKYYTSGEPLRYAVLHGNYVEILFQIKRFVEEAEYMRSFIPFMYDGVVISYIEPDLIDKLGRVNSVNKYSMAIKFNPLKRQTIFLGYDYTVGQDGSITPMIHYRPVEFFGTIHDKSTGHSYERFKTLNLKRGDVLDVEYVNDVMPYVSKPDNPHNDTNQNEPEKFITECPECGSKLTISDSGKTVYCKNPDCNGRKLARIVNMLDKLNVKDFSDAYLKKIGKYSLSEMLEIKQDEINFLGEIISNKFIEQMNSLKIQKIYDYNIVGALGFTNIAVEKWRLIFNHYTLKELMTMDDLKQKLVNIKGIGPISADVISREMEFFKKDLEYISNMSNIISSKGDNSSKKIRFTGIRDQSLVEKLKELGHNAGEGSVTKDTDILIVPDINHVSSKTKKAMEYGISIVALKDFEENMDNYLI